VNTEFKDRMIDDLRTIVEKVEQKAHVPPDNPDASHFGVLSKTKSLNWKHNRISIPHPLPTLQKIP